MNIKNPRKWGVGIGVGALAAGLLAGASSLDQKVLGIFTKQATEQTESERRQAQLDAIVKSENYGDIKALYSDSSMAQEKIQAASEMIAGNYFRGLKLEDKEVRKKLGRRLLAFFENFKEDSFFFKNASQAQMEKWITKNWMRDKETAVRLRPEMVDALNSYFSGQFSEYGAVCIPGNGNGYPVNLLVSASAFSNPASVRQIVYGAVSGYRNIEPLLRQ